MAATRCLPASISPTRPCPDGMKAMLDSMIAVHSARRPYGPNAARARIESDLIDLSPVEAKEFLKELGVEESGVGALIRATYHLLGLRTFFTASEKEVRAWTIHAGDTAPRAAGVIHSDFERGFIKAETVAYDDLMKCGSVAAAREKGLYRMEGKEYVVQDGDVLLFKFAV